MPPAIPIIAGLAASGLGAAAGGGLADALGGFLATDVLGSSLGAGLGGALGGGAAGALLDKGNPLMGGLLGGAGGFVGGPSIASGVESAASGVANDLGIGGASATAPAGTAVPGAMPVTSSTLPPAAAATAAPPAGGGGAAAIAPPVGVPAATDATAAATAPAASATGVVSQLNPTPAAPLGTPGAAPVSGSTTGIENIAFSGPTGLTGQPLTGAQVLGGGAGNTTTAAPSTFDTLLNDPTSGKAWGDFAKANPGAIIGGLGLGYDILNQGNIQGMGALQNEATMAAKSSQELQSYVNSGNLPPGFQASMDQAKQAAKAQLRSKYASLGMSGSTAESQDLANVDVQAVAAQAQVAAQLLQSGISESNVAGDLLSKIVGINQTQDQATAQAISAFAAALSPNMGGMQLYLRPPGT